jgi:hypothetical protein
MVWFSEDPKAMRGWSGWTLVVWLGTVGETPSLAVGLAWPDAALLILSLAKRDE